jgi:lipid-A-disaccharide synthase
LIQTAQELRHSFPQAQFTVFRPAELADSRYRPFLAQTPWIRLAFDPDYEQRKKLSLAISVSGTAALENTLLGIPMIVMYKLSPLTYAIARRMVRVSYVAIPNILAGKPLVPELLQTDATPNKLAAAARAILEKPATGQRMRQDLLALRAQLGQPGAAQRAADEILHVL